MSSSPTSSSPASSSPAAPAAHELPELDVSGMRKPDKHPTIFATFRALPVGGAFVLVNDHDPKHLHDEFETELGGGYDWEYLNQEMRDWRIKITKLAATPLPRVVVDTAQIPADAPAADATGAAWRLTVRERDLDAHVIVMAAGESIEAHDGPDLDVLVQVIAGHGEVVTERGTVVLAPGAVLWMPRRSRRAINAGADGLRYLAVHQRRQTLSLQASGASATG